MTALPFLLISLKCQSIARNRQPSFLTLFLILPFQNRYAAVFLLPPNGPSLK
jgi:hypothetical protein